MADYTWQKKAVERFTDERISAIVAACGTGKTRAGIRLAVTKFMRRHMPVIIIAPKRLTGQWSDAIHEIAGDDEKIWIYDAVEEHKNPAKYEDKLRKWLED